MMTLSRGSLLLAVLLGLHLQIAGCAPTSSRSGSSDLQDDIDSAFYASEFRDPTAKTLMIMAQICARQGQDAEAEYVLQRVVQEHPAHMPAQLDLAELYMRHGQTDRAIGVLSAAHQITPKDPIVLNNLGMCYLLKGQEKEALARFEQALALLPQDRRFQVNMAVALGMTGRYEEALKAYEQVLSPSDARYNLAVLCAARGDYQRAAEERTRALEASIQKSSPRTMP